jgi:HAD superfamily 5'-nucleotidase-like hydrolase
VNRTRLFALTRDDLPDLLERAVEVAPMDARRKVFVNRNLRLDKVEQIGFDMDYTLAIYKKLKIEELAFILTVDKLVRKRGYPEAIRDVAYEPDRVIRGLLCDKRNGNILKIDRYGHIGRVFHGATELPKEERIEMYRTRKLGFKAENFAWVDTLFALPEACLYSQLVEFWDAAPAPPGGKPSYRQLYKDIRECIDEAHADNSLKSVIKKSPGTYIEREVELAHALHRFRSAGKKLFLLTNSLWDYTNAVMTFLLDGMLEGYPSWKNYFDAVIVGARKPDFFQKTHPFLRVDEATGTTSAEPAVIAFERGKVYQAGNLKRFEKLVKCGGERILYVGDHIYGDILRSKRSSLWRTAMIVPELEDVVWHHDLFAADMTRYAELEDEMRRVDYEINYYKTILSSLSRLKESGASKPEEDAEDPLLELAEGGNGAEGSISAGPGAGLLAAARAMAESRAAAAAAASSGAASSSSSKGDARGKRAEEPQDPALAEATRYARESLDRLKAQLRGMVREVHEIERRVDTAANKRWGLTFTEGSETSLFGKQVEDYACVYTSRVSNFVFYSPLQYFRSPRHLMPHERTR